MLTPTAQRGYPRVTQGDAGRTAYRSIANGFDPILPGASISIYFTQNRNEGQISDGDFTALLIVGRGIRLVLDDGAVITRRLTTVEYGAEYNETLFTVHAPWAVPGGRTIVDQQLWVDETTWARLAGMIDTDIDAADTQLAARLVADRALQARVDATVNVDLTWERPPPEWMRLTSTNLAAGVGSSSFIMVGDYRVALAKGRAIRLVGATTVIGRVLQVTYTAPHTTAICYDPFEAPVGPLALDVSVVQMGDPLITPDRIPNGTITPEKIWPVPLLTSTLTSVFAMLRGLLGEIPIDADAQTLAAHVAVSGVGPPRHGVPATSRLIGTGTMTGLITTHNTDTRLVPYGHYQIGGAFYPYQRTALRGKVGGYAPLDSAGQIPRTHFVGLPIGVKRVQEVQGSLLAGVKTMDLQLPLPVVTARSFVTISTYVTTTTDERSVFCSAELLSFDQGGSRSVVRVTRAEDAGTVGVSAIVVEFYNGNVGVP